MISHLFTAWIAGSFGFLTGWGIRSLVLHSRKRQRPFRG